MTYEERLLKERDELHAKLNKLNAFISADNAFSQLEPTYQDLLKAQSYAMETYLHILNMRIAA